VERPSPSAATVQQLRSGCDREALNSMTAATEPSAHSSRGIGAKILHEALEALPPTIFFALGFNIIVLTTNLLLAEYLVAFGNFIVATFAALVVGKAVLIANAMPMLRRYDRAPLIQPILFKTVIYCVVVFIARLLERFVHYAVIDGEPIGAFPTYLYASFSWHRFAAIQIWIFVLFLLYVTATEFSQLLGPGELRRVLFTRRPSQLRLTRQQRIRELMHLSQLTDGHAIDEFQDEQSPVHRELFGILRRLARPSRRAPAE
jgi:hypothetical protein